MSRLIKSAAYREMERFLKESGYPATITPKRRHYAVMDGDRQLCVFSRGTGEGSVRGFRNVQAAVRRHFRGQP